MGNFNEIILNAHDDIYELLRVGKESHKFSGESLRYDEEKVTPANTQDRPFSWIEYFSFFAIGLSMTWTWSMIVAAFPLYVTQLNGGGWVRGHLQVSIVLTFSIVILLVNAALMSLRFKAAYSERLKYSLVAYIAIPLFVAMFTIEPSGLDDLSFLFFLILMTGITAIANTFSQNSAFAIVASFGKPEYVPAILTAEAVACILPPAIEIFSVVVSTNPSSATTNIQFAASWSFLSASFVGGCSMIALSILTTRMSSHAVERIELRSQEMKGLWSKLKWMATSNALCLCISSISSLFSTRIVSVVPASMAPRILQSESFIPLSLLTWNLGELFGSTLTIFLDILTRKPILTFCLSLGRLVFIPLFLMCNVNNQGYIFGDVFYLAVAQFLFGASHGFLSSSCMMAVPTLVDTEEREDAGAFMGLSVVFGLAFGGIFCIVVDEI